MFNLCESNTSKQKYKERTEEFFTFHLRLLGSSDKELYALCEGFVRTHGPSLTTHNPDPTYTLDLVQIIQKEPENSCKYKGQDEEREREKPESSK